MNRRISLILLLPIILFISCSHPSYIQSTNLLDVEFESFQLNDADNVGLGYDLTGRLEGNTITLEYPDFSIPGYSWVPRFFTDAISVEIDGVEQSSGISMVDFSKSVSYTLTARSGMVQQFNVELVLQPGWQDMGTALLVWDNMFPSSIRTGYLNNLVPFFVYQDSVNTLHAFALDLLDGTTWNEYFGGPNTIEAFDSLFWNNQIWTVSQTVGPGGQIQAQFCFAPNAWSAITPVTPYTGMAAELHSFSSSTNFLFAAWIDDALNAKTPIVWGYNGAIWQQLGSSIVDEAYGGGLMLHAESFRAVSDNGANVYAASTFEEAAGLIHLFQFNEGSGAWMAVAHESSAPYEETDRIIVDMFYDTERQSPVIFTRSKNYNYENIYTVKALYFNDLAGVWTDIDYMDAFYVPEADYTSLSISWYENKPSAVFGKNVLNWDGDQWGNVGQSHYTSDSSIQSLSKGILDTYYTVLRDDASGDLVVRYYQ
jgi:hypothetical protein